MKTPLANEALHAPHNSSTSHGQDIVSAGQRLDVYLSSMHALQACFFP